MAMDPRITHKAPIRPTGTTQAQVDHQIATTGASANIHGQDKLVRDARRANSMKLVGAQAGQRRVLDRSGVTKAAKARKG